MSSLSSKDCLASSAGGQFLMSQQTEAVHSDPKYAVGLWAERKLEQPVHSVNLAERLTLRVAVSKKPLELRTLSDFSSLELFRTNWKSWPGTLASDIDYFCAMLRARGADCKPHVVMLIRDGEPDAMLVGFRQRRKVPAKLGTRAIFNTRANVLEFVTGSLRGNSSEANCAALVREVMRSLAQGEADFALWDDLDVQSPLYQHALQLPHRSLADHCSWQVDRWLMKFPNGLDDFLMSLERSQRSKLRRKYKKVLSHFDQRLELRIVNSLPELQSVIPHFEEIAAKTEKRKMGFGFFDTPEIRQELLDAAENGWLRAFLVYLDGQPAAFWIGTLYNRSLQADYVGYDPSWAEFSPGIFLFLSLLNVLHGEDISTIDFGRGESQLRQCFSDVKHVEAKVRIHAPTLRGLWLNLARTFAFKSTRLLRRANGFSLSRILESYFRGDASNVEQASPSNTPTTEYVVSGELEQVSTSL
jgi:hypothetical protein